MLRGLRLKRDLDWQRCDKESEDSVPSDKLDDEEDYFKDKPTKKKAAKTKEVRRVADVSMPRGLTASKEVIKSKVNYFLIQKFKWRMR